MYVRRKIKSVIKIQIETATAKTNNNDITVKAEENLETYYSGYR